jgi:hypothetical protein
MSTGKVVVYVTNISSNSKLYTKHAVTRSEVHADVLMSFIFMVGYVLYGCETWSLILREELRLRVFENRVLRIFGPKRDEVTGQWIKLHSGELHNLYSSPDSIWRIK